MNHLTPASRALKRIIPSTLLPMLLAAGSCLAASWEGTDDFAAGVSTARWRITDRNDGEMVVAGSAGHLSFRVPSSSRETQNAFVVWRGTPTAAEDWTVTVRGHNSGFHGEWDVTLQLAVLNTTAYARGDVEAFVVSMQNDDGDSMIGTSWWHYGSGPGSGWTPRLRTPIQALDFRLRLTYHAANRTLRAWYSPHTAGEDWVSVDAMGLNQMSPSMTTTDTLSFAILGNTDYGPIPEGELWADDFRLQSGAPGLGEAPKIVTEPTDQAGVVGGNASFRITASGTAPLAYQWRRNGSNLADGARVSGATTATLTLGTIVTSDAGDYTVVVSNAYGSVTSAVAVLTVPAAVPYVQTVAVTNVGASALITLDAQRHGDPFNLAGDRTPYRMLIDVTAGWYRIEIVNSVPGFVAWSPGFGGYSLPGIGLLEYADEQAQATQLSLPWTANGATPEAAFAALAPKSRLFRVSEDMTLNAHLQDHMLADNSGGASFLLTKVGSLELAPRLTLRFTAGRPVLEVRGQPGHAYALEQREDLGSGSWNRFTTLSLSNAVQTFELGAPPVVERFYRATLVP